MWPHIAIELMWQSGFSDKLPSGSEGFRLLCLVTSSQKSFAMIPGIREILRKAKSAVTPRGACGQSPQFLPAPQVFLTKTNPRSILQIEVPFFSLPWSFGGLTYSGFLTPLGVSKGHTLRSPCPKSWGFHWRGTWPSWLVLTPASKPNK